MTDSYVPHFVHASNLTYLYVFHDTFIHTVISQLIGNTRMSLPTLGFKFLEIFLEA